MNFSVVAFCNGILASDAEGSAGHTTMRFTVCCLVWGSEDLLLGCWWKFFTDELITAGNTYRCILRLWLVKAGYAGYQVLVSAYFCWKYVVAFGVLF